MLAMTRLRITCYAVKHPDNQDQLILACMIPNFTCNFFIYVIVDGEHNNYEPKIGQY